MHKPDPKPSETIGRHGRQKALAEYKKKMKEWAKGQTKEDISNGFRTVTAAFLNGCEHLKVKSNIINAIANKQQELMEELLNQNPNFYGDEAPPKPSLALDIPNGPPKPIPAPPLQRPAPLPPAPTPPTNNGTPKPNVIKPKRKRVRTDEYHLNLFWKQYNKEAPSPETFSIPTDGPLHIKTERKILEWMKKHNKELHSFGADIALTLFVSLSDDAHKNAKNFLACRDAIIKTIEEHTEDYEGELLSLPEIPEWITQILDGKELTAKQKKLLQFILLKKTYPGIHKSNVDKTNTPCALLLLGGEDEVVQGMEGVKTGDELVQILGDTIFMPAIAFRQSSFGMRRQTSRIVNYELIHPEENK